MTDACDPRAVSLHTQAGVIVRGLDPLVRVDVTRQLYPPSHRIELQLHYAADFVVSEHVSDAVFARALRLAYQMLAADVRAQLSVNLNQMGPL